MAPYAKNVLTITLKTLLIVIQSFIKLIRNVFHATPLDNAYPALMAPFVQTAELDIFSMTLICVHFSQIQRTPFALCAGGFPTVRPATHRNQFV
jgi:hypothetical protein